MWHKAPVLELNSEPKRTYRYLLYQFFPGVTPRTPHKEKSEGIQGKQQEKENGWGRRGNRKGDKEERE
jgi:hypothetical protein